MGTPTTNLGIVKPAGTDAFNRTAFNVILDQIDAAAVPNSKLGTGANQVPTRDVNGNLQNIGNKVTAKSANATLLLSESGIIDVTTGATNKTMTLPDATTPQVSFIIKKVDSGVGTVVINTTSAQLIDGVASKTITFQYDYIQFVSDGVGWQIIDGSVIATQTAGNNSTRPASTAYVDTAIAAIPAVNPATPSALGTVEIAAAPAAGSPIVSTRVGNAIESLLTTTGATNVLSYTPAAAGNFLIYVSARVITAATNITVEVDYTDAGGAQVNMLYPIASVPVGTHMLNFPLFINAVAGSAIVVKVTAGTANQVYISSSIVGV